LARERVTRGGGVLVNRRRRTARKRVQIREINIEINTVRGWNDDEFIAKY
uniref:HNH endonuclease n=1 Tax=Anisakis simplex TaxID=6269 RepID=A0A0M3JGF1_ANISI